MATSTNRSTVSGCSAAAHTVPIGIEQTVRNAGYHGTPQNHIFLLHLLRGDGNTLKPLLRRRKHKRATPLPLMAGLRCRAIVRSRESVRRRRTTVGNVYRERITEKPKLVML